MRLCRGQNRRSSNKTSNSIWKARAELKSNIEANYWLSGSVKPRTQWIGYQKQNLGEEQNLRHMSLCEMYFLFYELSVFDLCLFVFWDFSVFLICLISLYSQHVKLDLSYLLQKLFLRITFYFGYLMPHIYIPLHFFSIVSKPRKSIPSISIINSRFSPSFMGFHL